MTAGIDESDGAKRAPRPGANQRLAAVAAVAVVVLVAVIGFASTRSPDRADPERTSGSAATASDAGSGGGTSASGQPGSSAGPASGSAAETPAETTTTEPDGPAEITLAFAGDLLPHSPVNTQAQQYGAESGLPYDFAPMFAPMAPVLGPADLAICHMEVVVAPPGEGVSTYPSFGAPAELVDGVASAGYDGCSNASNHSLDRGQAGIAATLERFDQLGLRHAGIARTAEEASVITTYDVDGMQVAHLSYAYDFNGYAVPADAPWAVDQIDPDRIRADAAEARAAGAELVVVSLHWGNEYDAEPSAYQRDIAGQILPSPDIDLVIGHHAHVVQPIEAVAGTYVVWGLGNQLSNQSEQPRRDGLTVVVRAERDAARWKVSAVEAVPTWVDLATFRVLPVVATLADPTTPPGLRDELSGSYDRTVATVTGPATPGVSVAPKP